MSNGKETYDRFLTVLRSDAILPIPADTALGAVSHYLGTSELGDLPDLIAAVLGSKSLARSIPTVRDRQRGISRCFRDATTLRAATEKQRAEGRYFAGYRRKQRTGAWARVVVEGIKKAGTRADEWNYASQYAMVGFLKGLKQTTGEGGWKETVDGLEDEVVLFLAENLEKSSGAQDHIIDLVAGSLPLLPAEKSTMLLPVGIRTKLSKRLIQIISTHRLGQSEYLDESGNDATIANALAKTFDLAIDMSSKGKEKAWYDAEIFAKELLSSLKGQSLDAVLATTLIVPPGNSIIRLLCSTPPDLSRLIDHHAAIQRIVSDLIVSLALLSSSDANGTQAAQIQGYEGLLYGCLDLVGVGGDGSGGDALVKRLDGLDGPANTRMAQDAFTLNVAEQLIGSLSPKTLRDVVLPICQRYLQDVVPVSQAVEAAHSVILACLGGSVARTDVDFWRPVAEEMVCWYLNCVIDHTLREILTKEQSMIAYCAVTRVGFLHSNILGMHCINILAGSINGQSGNPERPSPQVQILRLDLIAALPLVMAPYLHHVLHRSVYPIVVDLPVGSGDRGELVSGLFREIREGLGDYSKVIGYRFWAEYGERLKSLPSVVAKL